MVNVWRLARTGHGKGVEIYSEHDVPNRRVWRQQHHKEPIMIYRSVGVGFCIVSSSTFDADG